MFVSGVDFSRDMTEVSAGSDEARTVVFPNTIRRVRNGLFYGAETLRSAVLNEGLEVLGTDEYQADGDLQKGVFEESGLTKVRLPSTLKRIEYAVFKMCASLKSIQLPDGLGYIGKVAFGKCGLESVTLPNSVREICVQAFFGCESLRDVQLNEGLRQLGETEYVKGIKYTGQVFAECGLESIALPSTLRVIEEDAFYECRDLKEVQLPEGLEEIKLGAFFKSGLERVNLPASVRTVAQAAFARCENLKSATLNEGLEVLGTDEYSNGDTYYGVFQESPVEHVRLPSTLTRIGYNAFKGCKSLKEV